MGIEFGSHDRRDRMLREWLLLLLRFAVAREQSDRSVALTMAEELDSFGRRWRPAGPCFFARTTNEVCDAIVADSDPQRDALLRKHIGRIDNFRLQRAFRSAVGLQSVPPQSSQRVTTQETKNSDLWKGLLKR